MSSYAAHLQTLIHFAREVQRKGVEPMDFHAFNREELDHYTQEVKERWGATQAYAEFVEKSRGLTQNQRDEAVEQLLSRFAQLGALRRQQYSPTDPAVQETLSDLQDFIAAQKKRGNRTNLRFPLPYSSVTYTRSYPSGRYSVSAVSSGGTTPRSARVSSRASKSPPDSW